MKTDMTTREHTPGFNNGFGVENPSETTLDYAFNIADRAQPPAAKHGRSIVVGAAGEIGPGDKRIVDVEGISIGVYNIAGKFYAIKNLCPHAGAPLCRGHIQTTHRPGEVGEFNPALAGRVLRCPWHGWEFDIVTGKGLYDRTSRVATYPVRIDDAGNLVVLL